MAPSASAMWCPTLAPAGNNSDYIGLDTVSITAAVPEPSTWALMALGLGAVALRRRKQKAD